jgi:hypothetical protein
VRSNRFAPLLAGLLGLGLSGRATMQGPVQLRPEGSNWDFGAAVYAYFVPNDIDYMQPTFAADRLWLHLEARYNYEDLETGSVWLGYNYSIGERLTLTMTPLFGGVIGKTTGIAFGYQVAIDWWRLELLSEGEFLIDTGHGDDHFFYSWSELTLTPVDWLRFGIAAQRTRVFESERELQPGVLLGVRFGPVGVTGHVFDPDTRTPVVVVSVEAEF